MDFHPRPLLLLLGASACACYGCLGATLGALILPGMAVMLPPRHHHPHQCCTFTIRTEHDDMSHPSIAQAVPPPNKPMSVELARALGEAADGLAKDENPFYLVSPYEPITDLFAGGFEVFGPFDSYDDVPDKLRGDNFGFFGPFRVTLPLVNGRRVAKVDLHIEEWPEPFRFRIMPDALFFSAEAVEKFALPYYERIFGPEFAAKVAEQFQFADVQVMAHYPWSEYSDSTREPAPRVPNSPVFLFRDRAGGMMHASLPAAGGTVALRPVIVGRGR